MRRGWRGVRGRWNMCEFAQGFREGSGSDADREQEVHEGSLEQWRWLRGVRLRLDHGEGTSSYSCAFPLQTCGQLIVSAGIRRYLATYPGSSKE